MLSIVLWEPEIPPNTGNIIRLCANTGFQLHLLRPLGFELEDSKLKRAGLDYHEWAKVQVHDDFDAFMRAAQPTRIFACSTRTQQHYHQIRYQAGDALIFGPETRGLPQSFLDRLGPEQGVRIPMRPNNRSLNLSNAVAVIAYEAWRQLDFAGS